MLEELWGEISTNLWFQLTLLLMVAIVSSYLFARAGQPKIMGQIILGIIIGPSVLGIIKVGSPLEGDMVHNLAQLGAVIMLFMIGLECNIKELYTRQNILIAIGGVSLPWILGFFLAYYLLPDSDFGGDKFIQSIFIGTILVATSVAITAGVLREMKLIGSKLAKTILGAAIVDDVIGMIILAISMGVASEGSIDVTNIVIMAVAAILFVTLGSYLGSHFVTKVINKVEKRGILHGVEESGFLLALSFALLYAFISELIGISIIVGAFIAGTSFSQCEYRIRFRHSARILEWVFAPIFFLSLGIIADIRLLDSPVWLIFAFTLGGIAILSKVIGCAIPARIFGMNKEEAIAVGFGMAPRMEVVMIIAFYALTAPSGPFISNEVYSTIIIMALITVLVAPFMLRSILKGYPESEAFCETD